MWWEKKTRRPVELPAIIPIEELPATPRVETSMSEPSLNSPVAGDQHTLLGRTVVMHGELSAGEDLRIEGEFEGNIRLDGHCLTVGPAGRVKAEVRARQVVVFGAMDGNVIASEKIDIRRSGRVVGDLVAATVAIEDGAYFKGSIDIARGETPEAVGAAVATPMRNSA